MKLTEDMEGLLVEFDEYGFAPTITMPNAEEYAKAWRNNLVDLFERLCFWDAEQKEEIERLTGENTDLHLDKQELMNEISEHKNAYARLNDAYVNLNNLYQQAVKDTAKEILHEEFGIPYDEICKEITEGK